MARDGHAEDGVPTREAAEVASINTVKRRVGSGIVIVRYKQLPHVRTQEPQCGTNYYQTARHASRVQPEDEAARRGQRVHIQQPDPGPNTG